ncbi:uncharacterized protein TNCV_335311 [Trichonephila clavipes]|nr:uncharacterized protein TNCV_335311 [Trichonephila clavipes]
MRHSCQRSPTPGVGQRERLKQVWIGLQEGGIRSGYLPYRTQVLYRPRQNHRFRVMFGTSLCTYPTATYPHVSDSANRRTNDTIFVASMFACSPYGLPKVGHNLFARTLIDMDICKCIVPSRHGGTLNCRRVASPLVWLVEGEERWEASDHPQSVLSLNWGGTEPNRTVTRMAPKTTANERRHLALCHDEFRGPQSGLCRSGGIGNNNKIHFVLYNSKSFRYTCNSN